MKYKSFHPGQPWLDTNGKRIHAHGGSIFYENGRYYWYGENKEKTTGLDSIWHWGIRCYVSGDLYNWDDLGLIIPPEPDDPASTLHPSKCVDRPHILYNRKTGKYVCWLKVMSVGCTVLTADALLGPYTVVHEGLWPLGMEPGDFDLAVAPDGKAYYFFERVHSELICADLTDDYTNVTGYYSTHFPRLGPPYTREAPAHFIRKGKHYLLTSGTTGYFPNPSELAIADTWHGPYRVLGDPHPADDTRTSFHSQISSVFRVPGKKDLYIALADRWLPQRMSLSYEKYRILFERGFGSNPNAVYTPQQQKETLDIGIKNTVLADYIWLPLRFDGEMAYIDWLDEWKLEDYEWTAFVTFLVSKAGGQYENSISRRFHNGLPAQQL